MNIKLELGIFDGLMLAIENGASTPSKAMAALAEDFTYMEAKSSFLLCELNSRVSLSSTIKDFKAALCEVGALEAFDFA